MALKRLYSIGSTCFNALKILLRGHPLTIETADRFFKIAIRASAIKQLNREVRNTNTALKWDIYSDKVIKLNKHNRFMAWSPLLNDDECKTWRELYVLKHHKMMDLSITYLNYALDAPQKPAQQLLQMQIDKLNVDLNKNEPFFLKFKNIFNSFYFSYHVPVTPMHGDFIPINVIIYENKIHLADWEYALSEGSIIYDWWFLAKAIKRNRINTQGAEQYFKFLENAITKLDISKNQFEAFGNAMHTIINFSRAAKRKSDKFEEYFNDLTMIVKS